MNLLRDVDTSYLQHIEEIIPGTGSHTLKHTFFQIFYNFHQTLIHLRIDYDESNTINTENRSTLYLLAKFNCLTHVSIYNYADNNLYFIGVLDACANITSLDFSSDFDVPDPVFDLGANTSHKKLKHIELGIPTLTLPSMKYFIHHHLLSKRLETFKIKLRSNECYGWVNTEGMNTVLELARHLSYVKNIHFYSNPENDGTAVLHTSKNKMTMLFSFINALKGDRIMDCNSI